MTELLVAKCSRKAAQYAVTRWHYSQVLPAGKLVTYGAWENSQYIGCVIFSRGATHHLAAQWGYSTTEAVELTRVALSTHVSPVSQIVAAALRMLKQSNPGLQLVVSFADPAQDHHGGIYQAGNWLYTGQSATSTEFVVFGTQYHARSIHAKGWKQTAAWLQHNIDPNARTVKVEGKHRYLMPLSRHARRRMIKHARPYPRATAGEASTVTRSSS